MGLAVSQIRLLALTTRKADIELQMQINSKRKQMLTRRSTELAQQYYNRLQDSNVQYATSAGYEDVNYSYLMGQTNPVGRYTDTFLKQIMCGNTSDGTIPQKFENGMILTDQYGQVVVNNQIAEVVAKTQDCYPPEKYTTLDQTAHAIVTLIQDNANNGLSNLDKMMRDPTGNIDKEKLKAILNVLRMMVTNGGGKDGGFLYTPDLETFYCSAEGMKNGNPDDIVTPQEGYMYSVRGSGSTGTGLWNSSPYNLSTKNVYIGGEGAAAFLTDADFSPTNMEYLGNIVSYFAPILSAALTNGTTAKVDRFSPGTNIVDVTTDPTSSYSGTAGDYIRYVDGHGGIIGYYQYDGSNVTAIETDPGIDPIGQNKTNASDPSWPTSYPGSAAMAALLPNTGDWCLIDGKYYQNTGENPDGSPHIEEFVGDNSAEKFYSNFVYKTKTNDSFYSATNTEVLQSGFKSGVYQLCMVDDPMKGIYHKNTTLKYFTHMNYVIEKADSSKREEVTAWFNAENALISEQETYWDTEIQNLSTELTSVNTEIESVKRLKSDSIKSVFDWGGNS